MEKYHDELKAEIDEQRQITKLLQKEVARLNKVRTTGQRVEKQMQELVDYDKGNRERALKELLKYQEKKDG